VEGVAVDEPVDFAEDLRSIGHPEPRLGMLHQSISAANLMQKLGLSAVTVSNPLTLS
jgi:hypothetical protein